jgi:hypothetical protein
MPTLVELAYWARRATRTQAIPLERRSPLPRSLAVHCVGALRGGKFPTGPSEIKDLVQTTTGCWLSADVTAYVAALALPVGWHGSAFAAGIVLFPGVAMEAAELVTAGWLVPRRRTTAWVSRLRSLSGSP